jgi:hypothetical protein
VITFTGLGNHGRLGNQLFQIASTIGLSIKHNTNYSFPEWNYAKYLKTELPVLSGNINHRIEHNDFNYIDLAINRDGITDIFGYFQSYRFFDNVNVAEIFEIKDEYLQYRDKYNLENSVSIHVRRTDYLLHTHVYPIISIDYYKRALLELNKLGVCYDTIYVFSDDIEWCKSNFNFIENIHFISGYNDIVDLYMMSECKHNIISNSTFSWWAAYLNKNLDKKIICPDTWFNPCPEINNFIYSDLIPEEWIKIHI